MSSTGVMRRRFSSSIASRASGSDRIRDREHAGGPAVDPDKDRGARLRFVLGQSLLRRRDVHTPLADEVQCADQHRAPPDPRLPLVPAIVVTQTLIELLSELGYVRFIARLGRPQEGVA